MAIVTTSWDDGHAFDMRLADLLDKYKMRGTFYVARDQKHRLSESQIRELSVRHEVGAHTLTHLNLELASSERRVEEIGGSKQWLESVIGKPVEMFCYPYGRFEAESKRIVQGSGFRGARSTEKILNATPRDSFMMPVSMMVYRSPYRVREKILLPALGEWLGNEYWERLAKRKIDEVVKEGGVFHLWGHSWEIDRLRLWGSLERFCRYITSCSDIRYHTNGELLAHLAPESISARIPE
jgi:peptidoglycan/xylan/chitin deacetylase (PgdA/CDA1 family)